MIVSKTKVIKVKASEKKAMQLNLKIKMIIKSLKLRICKEEVKLMNIKPNKTKNMALTSNMALTLADQKLKQNKNQKKVYFKLENYYIFLGAKIER